MANETTSNNGPLYFIIGVLVAAVAAFAIWYFAGQGGGESDGPSLSISVEDDGVTVDGDSE